MKQSCIGNNRGLPRNRVGGGGRRNNSGRPPAVAQANYGNDVNEPNPVGGGRAGKGDGGKGGGK